MSRNFEVQGDETAPASPDLPYLRSATLETQSDLMLWAKQFVDSPYADIDGLVNTSGAPETQTLTYTDGLDAYRSRLRDIPVLDKAEERELFTVIDESKLATARVIIDGYCAINGRAGLFVPEEKSIAVIQAGQQAKQKLMYHNLRLVAWRANYYNLQDNITMDIGDLISEGVLGLGNAIDRFDASTGYAFSTYAVPWIRNSMSRAIRSTSRVPEHYQGKIKPLREQLRDGKTAEEIATELGVTKATVESLTMALRPVSSLDTPLATNVTNGMTIGDSIADSATEASYDRVDDAAVHANLQMMLGGLTEQQSRVMRLRFGIGGGEPMTLEKIGAEEGVSRQRIMQIEKLAFRKLRERAAELGMVWTEHFA